MAVQRIAGTKVAKTDAFAEGRLLNRVATPVVSSRIERNAHHGRAI